MISIAKKFQGYVAYDNEFDHQPRFDLAFNGFGMVNDPCPRPTLSPVHVVAVALRTDLIAAPGTADFHL